MPTERGKELKRRMTDAMSGAVTTAYSLYRMLYYLKLMNVQRINQNTVTIKPEPIVAKAEMGEVSVEVHSWPSKFHVNQFVRQRRLALSDNPKATDFTWSKYTIDLMKMPEALNRVTEEGLQREKHYGFGSTGLKADTKKDVPWGMQVDMPRPYFGQLVDEEIDLVTNGEKTMTESLEPLISCSMTERLNVQKLI